MCPVRIDAVVRLEEDAPNLGLRRGAEGVVTGIFVSPWGLLCEVQFSASDASKVTSALVPVDQLKAVEP
jgi:hypothetical protein